MQRIFSNPNHHQRGNNNNNAPMGLGSASSSNPNQTSNSNNTALPFNFSHLASSRRRQRSQDHFPPPQANFQQQPQAKRSNIQHRRNNRFFHRTRDDDDYEEEEEEEEEDADDDYQYADSYDDEEQNPFDEQDDVVSSFPPTQTRQQQHHANNPSRNIDTSGSFFHNNNISRSPGVFHHVDQKQFLMKQQHHHHDQHQQQKSHLQQQSSTLNPRQEQHYQKLSSLSNQQNQPQIPNVSSQNPSEYSSSAASPTTSGLQQGAFRKLFKPESAVEIPTELPGEASEKSKKTPSFSTIETELKQHLSQTRAGKDLLSFVKPFIFNKIIKSQDLPQYVATTDEEFDILKKVALEQGTKNKKYSKTVPRGSSQESRNQFHFLKRLLVSEGMIDPKNGVENCTMFGDLRSVISHAQKLLKDEGFGIVTYQVTVQHVNRFLQSWWENKSILNGVNLFEIQKQLPFLLRACLLPPIVVVDPALASHTRYLTCSSVNCNRRMVASDHGHFKFRRLYDRDGGSILVYKTYYCPSCDVGKKDENDESIPKTMKGIIAAQASTAQDAAQEISGQEDSGEIDDDDEEFFENVSTHARPFEKGSNPSKLDKQVENELKCRETAASHYEVTQRAAPLWFRRSHNITFTWLCAFTHGVSSDCILTADSRSNVHELSNFYKKRYGEHHLIKVIQVNSLMSQWRPILFRGKTEAKLTQHEFDVLISSFAPSLSESTANFALLSSPSQKTACALLRRPLISAPGYNFLRTSVLEPELNLLRSSLQKCLEVTGDREIVSVDSTYRVADSTSAGRAAFKSNVRSSIVTRFRPLPQESPFFTNQDLFPSVYRPQDAHLFDGENENKQSAIDELLQIQQQFENTEALRLLRSYQVNLEEYEKFEFNAASPDQIVTVGTTKSRFLEAASSIFTTIVNTVYDELEQFIPAVPILTGDDDDDDSDNGAEQPGTADVWADFIASPIADSSRQFNQCQAESIVAEFLQRASDVTANVVVLLRTGTKIHKAVPNAVLGAQVSPFEKDVPMFVPRRDYFSSAYCEAPLNDAIRGVIFIHCHHNGTSFYLDVIGSVPLLALDLPHVGLKHAFEDAPSTSLCPSNGCATFTMDPATLSFHMNTRVSKTNHEEDQINPERLSNDQWTYVNNAINFHARNQADPTAAPAFKSWLAAFKASVPDGAIAYPTDENRLKSWVGQAKKARQKKDESITLGSLFQQHSTNSNDDLNDDSNGGATADDAECGLGQLELSSSTKKNYFSLFGTHRDDDDDELDVDEDSDDDDDDGESSSKKPRAKKSSKGGTTKTKKGETTSGRKKKTVGAGKKQSPASKGRRKFGDKKKGKR